MIKPFFETSTLDLIRAGGILTNCLDCPSRNLGQRSGSRSARATSPLRLTTVFIETPSLTLHLHGMNPQHSLARSLLPVPGYAEIPASSKDLTFNFVIPSKSSKRVQPLPSIHSFKNLYNRSTTSQAAIYWFKNNGLQHASSVLSG